MALRKTRLETVDLGSAPIDRYESLLGEVWPQFRAAMEAFAGRMRGRTMNSAE